MNRFVIHAKHSPWHFRTHLRDACKKKNRSFFVFSRQGVGGGGGQIKIVFKIPKMSNFFFIELGKK